MDYLCKRKVDCVFGELFFAGLKEDYYCYFWVTNNARLACEGWLSCVRETDAVVVVVLILPCFR